jgi:hypothetical protein
MFRACLRRSFLELFLVSDSPCIGDFREHTLLLIHHSHFFDIFHLGPGISDLILHSEGIDGESQAEVKAISSPYIEVTAPRVT